VLPETRAPGPAQAAAAKIPARTFHMVPRGCKLYACVACCAARCLVGVVASLHGTLPWPAAAYLGSPWLLGTHDVSASLCDAALTHTPPLCLCRSSADRELVKYLHFLRRKRDSASTYARPRSEPRRSGMCHKQSHSRARVAVAEVAAEFNELKVSRLFDDENYAAEDVAAMLDGLLALVRSSMKQSLQTTNFGSVLLLKQVLEQCDEAQGLPINIETDLTVMDDRSKLAAVERWDQDVHGGSSSAPPPLRVRAAVSSRQGARALPVIGQAQVTSPLSSLLL
jgi:hypothetical protein